MHCRASAHFRIRRGYLALSVLRGSSQSTAGPMNDTKRTNSAPLPPTPRASPALRRGLFAYVGHRVVELLTEQQLVDHAVSALPQLKSVTSRPHFHGPHWTTLRKKHGVELYEFDPMAYGRPPSVSSVTATPPSTPGRPPSATPTPSSTRTRGPSTATATPGRRGSLMHDFQTQFKLPNPGIDMSYAAIAHCELECRIDDVLDVLFNDEAIDFESSMKALWNSKLKRGDLLLTRNVRGPPATATARSVAGYNSTTGDELADGILGTLTIKTATVGAGLSLRRKPAGAEKVCYTSFTQRSASGNEVYHAIKTLPLDVHDQIASGKTHVALRDAEVDHIAVGYHLTGYDSPIGGPRTRLVICAYASSRPSSRSSQIHWQPRMSSKMRLSSSSNTDGSGIVGSDVRRLVMMLAKAARNFQQVIRQRRFGHQRFVYFPTDRNSCRTLEQSCVVCLRRFGLFRRDHYCQLCGHLVCRQCSKKHKVEPTAGKVHENRICFPCVARVDTTAFYDEELWKSMARPVVVDAETISPMEADMITEPVHQSGRCRPPVEEETQRSSLDKTVEGASQWDGSESVDSVRSDDEYPISVRSDLQVACDLFSPHPQRRANALETLSRAVLHTQIPKQSSVNRMPSSEVSTTTELTAKNDPSVGCQVQVYPRSAVELSDDDAALLEHAEKLDYYTAAARATSSQTIDKSAMNSICETVAQQLKSTLVFVTVQTEHDEDHVVGIFVDKQMHPRLPGTLGFSGYLPQCISKAENLLVVNNPTCDARFRHFALIHQARARFFAGFPLRSNNSRTKKGALYVLGAEVQVLSKDQWATMETLCALATGLIRQDRP